MAASRGEERHSHDPSDSQSPSDDDDSGAMRNSSESASGEGDGGEESESAEPSTLQARSGITYDLAELDSDSEAKAVVGLTGRFDVVECVAAHGGYEFQLSEQPRVHVGSNRDTCTCSAFQRQPDTACQHIFVSGNLMASDPAGSNVVRRSGFLTSSTGVCPNDFPTMSRYRMSDVRRTSHR